jgi:hypothetical protein
MRRWGAERAQGMGSLRLEPGGPAAIIE